MDGRTQISKCIEMFKELGWDGFEMHLNAIKKAVRTHIASNDGRAVQVMKTLQELDILIETEPFRFKITLPTAKPKQQ